LHLVLRVIQLVVEEDFISLPCLQQCSIMKPLAFAMRCTPMTVDWQHAPT